MTSLPVPEETEPARRTVHVRVTYRMQIPESIPLVRCSIDRKLGLPPMWYSTGAPGPDGLRGTWATHPLNGDFLTYQEQWGEGDGFLWEAEEKVKALTAELDQLRADLETARAGQKTRREWSILRPADSEFLPLTPIGPPFCSTYDEGYAREAAARRFTADVLADCPLAYVDVTETEFTMVGAKSDD